MANDGRCAYCDGFLTKGNHYECMQALATIEHHERYPFVCPKCNGQKKNQTGMADKEQERDATDMEMGLSDWRWGKKMRVREIVKVPVFACCDLCEGVGRLSEEPVPVTGVVSWSLPKNGGRP